MAIFVDAQTDAADLSSLVNENGLFTTRYGDNPKKSWLYMQGEFDALLTSFEGQGDIAIDAINADVVTVEAAKDTALTTINSYASAVDTSKDNAIITIDSYVSDVDDSASAATSSINANKITVENAAANVDATIAELDSKYKLTAIGVDGAWQSGIDFTAYNQYLVFSGTAYQPKPETSLPYTTGASPDLDDVQPVAPNTADKIFVDNGGTIQDQLDGREFDTVADAIAFTKIDKLSGNRVYLKDRQAYFDVVLTSTVTPDSAAVIQSSANSLYSYSIEITESMALINFGCIGDGSTVNDSYLQPALDSGVSELDTGRSSSEFLFNAITIPRNIVWKGAGALVGQSIGVYPDRDLMRATDSAGRLALLESYNVSTVAFSGSDELRGNLTIKNSLITLTGGIQKLRVDEYLNLIDCSMHNCLPHAYLKNAVIYAPNLIISDSPDNGCLVERGGQLNMNGGRIYNSAFRGANLVLSGYFEIQDGGIYNTASGDTIAATGNVQITAKSCELWDGGRVGISLIYGVNADMINSSIRGHEGAGVACESNCTVLLESSEITGNGLNGVGAGVSTSYGGFVQCRYSTITGNGGPACENLTGGEIQAQGAIVDKSNNGGGVQFKALNGGRIVLDEMGDASTPTLSNTDCFPIWGTVGGGGAFCGRDDTGIASETGYSIKRLQFGSRTSTEISSGVINCDSTYLQVTNEGGAASDDLDTITVDDNYPCDIMFISPTDNATLVIKHNTGNIRTGDGLDITLSSKNRAAMLVLNPSTLSWMATKF